MSDLAQVITGAVSRTCSIKRGIFKNFARFIGKHLSKSFFLNEAVVRKKIFCEFGEFFKNIFFYRTPPVANLRLNNTDTYCGVFG